MAHPLSVFADLSFAYLPVKAIKNHKTNKISEENAKQTYTHTPLNIRLEPRINDLKS